MRFAILNGKIVPEQLLPSSGETVPISKIEHLPQPAMNPHYSYNEKLQKILAGKQLLLEDLPFTINDIQSHYENGYLLYRKSILIEHNQPKCVRCGNQERHLFATFRCARCGEDCVYCRKCIMMGRTSTCTPLVSWTGPLPSIEINWDEPGASLPTSNKQKEINIGMVDYVDAAMSKMEDKQKAIHKDNVDPVSANHSSSPLHWSGILSAGQKQASDQVVEAISQTDSLLVWAV